LLLYRDRLVNQVDRYSTDIRNNTDVGWLFGIHALVGLAAVLACYGVPGEVTEHDLAEHLYAYVDGAHHTYGELLAIACMVIAELQHEGNGLLVRGVAQRAGCFDVAAITPATKERLMDALLSLVPRREFFGVMDVTPRLSRVEADAIVTRALGIEDCEAAQSTADVVADTISTTVFELKNHVINTVLPALHNDDIRHCVSVLVRARHSGATVFLNAAGRSREVGRYFCNAIAAQGIGTQIIDEAMDTSVICTNADDILLTISGSGRTASVAHCLYALAKRGESAPHMISLTAAPHEPLWRATRHVLFIPGTTKCREQISTVDGVGRESTFEIGCLAVLSAVSEVVRKLSTNDDAQGTVQHVAPYIEQQLRATQPLLRHLLKQAKASGRAVEELKKVEASTKGYEGVNRTGDILRTVADWVERGRPPCVYLMAIGSAHPVAKLFAMRLRNIGFNVAVPGPSEISPCMQWGDVAVAISTGGDEERLLEMLAIAMALNNQTVVVCADDSSPIAGSATVCLSIGGRSSSGYGPRDVLQLTAFLYLEGVAVALMRSLGRTEQDLEHAQLQLE
jgi:D-arabinose 5-phosphate isomerase GutQ